MFAPAAIATDNTLSEDPQFTRHEGCSRSLLGAVRAASPFEAVVGQDRFELVDVLAFGGLAGLTPGGVGRDVDDAAPVDDADVECCALVGLRNVDQSAGCVLELD
jgi:hypothetical protein